MDCFLVILYNSIFGILLCIFTDELNIINPLLVGLLGILLGALGIVLALVTSIILDKD